MPLRLALCLLALCSPAAAHGKCRPGRCGGGCPGGVGFWGGGGRTGVASPAGATPPALSARRPGPSVPPLPAAPGPAPPAGAWGGPARGPGAVTPLRPPPPDTALSSSSFPPGSRRPGRGGVLSAGPGCRWQKPVLPGGAWVPGAGGAAAAVRCPAVPLGWPPVPGLSLQHARSRGCRGGSQRPGSRTAPLPRPVSWQCRCPTPAPRRALGWGRPAQQPGRPRQPPAELPGRLPGRWRGGGGVSLFLPGLRGGSGRAAPRSFASRVGRAGNGGRFLIWVWSLQLEPLPVQLTVLAALAGAWEASGLFGSCSLAGEPSWHPGCPGPRSRAPAALPRAAEPWLPVSVLP